MPKSPSNGPKLLKELISTHRIRWLPWPASKSNPPKSNSINCKANCKGCKDKSPSRRPGPHPPMPWPKAIRLKRVSKDPSIK